MLPFAAQSATISDWSYVNVDPGGPVAGTETGFSVIYDRSPTDPDAQTFGSIGYSAPEAYDPGLEVSNIPYTTGQGTYDGCITASSVAECDSGFQSGKRFKEALTGVGAIDLVFDVIPDDTDATYQAFHRMINLTGTGLDGFTVELGTGVGSDFVASTVGDGLGFSSTVELGPNDQAAFSQYPFGLFGDDAQPNPNPLFTLDGFFGGDSRSGFELSMTEDVITSGDFYGSYGDIFGDWISRDMTPTGLLWDYAMGAADPLVMAWDNGLGWEIRRGIDDSLDGVLGNISVNDVYALAEGDWQLFDYGDTAGVEAYLSSISLVSDDIEDLANLNLNYALDLGANFTGTSFTLRVNSIASVAAVPLPASGILLAGGLALIAAGRRRRRAA